MQIKTPLNCVHSGYDQEDRQQEITADKDVELESFRVAEGNANESIMIHYALFYVGKSLG